MILYIISALCGVFAILIAVKDAKVVVVIVFMVFVMSLVIYFFNHRKKNKDE